jgi:hypothetical protein
MNTRRACLLGLASIAGVGATAGASTWGEVRRRGPAPKFIKGHPDKVDFGHGLLVPMSKDAFHVLWEGDDRWITYGHGFGHNEAAAMGQAEEAAVGTMKLMLVTMAFAPERLERVDGGGWRLKSGNTDDLIRGEIYLPGRPVMPTTDPIYDYMGDETGDDERGGRVTHATTGWLIWKKDVTVGYVRNHARLLSKAE